MKTNILSLLLVFIVCASCATVNNKRTLFHVVKIDSISTYYLIYALKDGDMYKIFSKKSNEVNYTRKIQEGRNYSFNLIALFGRDSKLGPVNYMDVKCIGLPDSVTLCLEDGCLPNIYYSEDIKDLYMR